MFSMVPSTSSTHAKSVCISNDEILESLMTPDEKSDKGINVPGKSSNICTKGLHSPCSMIVPARQDEHGNTDDSFHEELCSQHAPPSSIWNQIRGLRILPYRPSFKNILNQLHMKRPVRRRLRRYYSFDLNITLSASKRQAEDNVDDEKCTIQDINHLPRICMVENRPRTAIVNAVDNVCRDTEFIADGSKPYCLPTVRGKHSDLKSLTPNTICMVENRPRTAIVNAVDNVCRDTEFIADGSKPYCLPTVRGKHSDLKSLTPNTICMVENRPRTAIVNAVDNVCRDAEFIADGSKPYCLPTVRGKHSDLKSLTPNTICMVENRPRTAIVYAVDNVCRDTEFIADGSKPYCLPTVRGKHSDLKSLTPNTVADVLKGSYSDQVDSCTVIDCRYPYEYNAGHIKGAINIYREEEVRNLMLQSTMKCFSSKNCKRNILIFHCEFSSERGPKLYRFLRNLDREIHKEDYPRLTYPEVYLLEGGYKNFYESQKDLCDPCGYKPMLHKDHATDLRHFRVKCKSWTSGEKLRPKRLSLRF